MADVVTIAIVVLVFFLAGAMVGAVSLIALSYWGVRRQASRPWRDGPGPRGGGRGSRSG